MIADVSLRIFFCIQVSSEWPGFPLGVKFDPSDVELLEHLAGKCGVGNTQPDMFINEFISTLEGDQGICCTHPENLQGKNSLTLYLSIQIYKLLHSFRYT